MVPIESGILLKNHVSCNFMLKYYITVSFWQFTKTSNQFFYLSTANENLEICMSVWFVQLNQSNQFWGNFIGCFNKWRLSQKIQNSVFVESCCIRGYDFYMTGSRNETTSWKFILNSRTPSIFPVLDIKKLAIVRKILWCFDTILHIRLIHLLFH